MDDDNQNDIERIEPPGEGSVTLTEDDALPPEEEDSQPEVAARDPKTGKWSKKHRERGEARKNMRQELEGLRTEKSSLQQRLDAMERGSQTQWQVVAAALSRLGNNGPAQVPQPTADDHALDAIEAKMDTELQALARDPKRSQAEYRKMERERIRIIGRMEANGLLRQQPQQRQEQGGLPPHYAYRNEMMKSEFPWLEADQPATKAAQKYRDYLLATGKPDSIETDRLACAHIAAERNLGGPVRPSQRNRQALAGIPSGGLTPRPGKRAIQLPAAVLRGTGLSEQRIAAALLSDDE